MSRTEVAIVETGVANVASIRAALSRCGARSRPTRSAEEVCRADAVVLPGVGAFAAGMQRLLDDGTGDAIVRRVRAGRPTLAVCLGLQLLCEGSDESPGVDGLGIIGGRVRRLRGPTVPQFGWNRVEPTNGWLVRSGYAYFANGFCLRSAPRGWSVARARHGEAFVAAVERDGLLACQFHPELSGTWGRELLSRWLAAREVPAC